MFNQLTDTTTAALGLGLLMAGLAAFYFVGRMRFMRTNVAGVEEFRGFAVMLLTRLFERALQLAGLAAVIAGIGLMYTGVHNNMVRKRASVDEVPRLTGMAKQSEKTGILIKPRADRQVSAVHKN